MPTAAENIQDGNIRHMIFLQRYSTQTVRKVIALLSRVDSQLVERLSREDISAISRARLDRLLESVREINHAAQLQIRGELRTELRELAKLEGSFQARLISGSIPIAFDVTTPAAQLLISAVNSRPFQGRLLKDWFRDLEANSFKRLRDTIRMGVVEGATTEELLRRIRGTRANGFKDGILDISRRGAEATVRTAVNHTATVASERLYEENADLIKGVKWVATLDGRTSHICRGLDGQVFDLDKGPRPPAHINCRSTTTPVLKSWKELGINLKESPEGTRASMNGQVPAGLNYNDWLKTQPKDFQDDVLGVKKGQLFRKGGLTMDKFVDRNGAEFTLDELRRREADAFEKAGL
jgi:SPP1 gp7 family putative phage head morphogenesis protein